MNVISFYVSKLRNYLFKFVSSSCWLFDLFNDNNNFGGDVVNAAPDADDDEIRKLFRWLDPIEICFFWLNCCCCWLFRIEPILFEFSSTTSDSNNWFLFDDDDVAIPSLSDSSKYRKKKTNKILNYSFNSH